MRSRWLLDSRGAQGFLFVLGLILTANFAVVAYHRWDEGGLPLIASIAGVLVSGFCTYAAGYFLVTGRHLSDRFSKSASSAGRD
jgi:hypothetical protein